MNRRHQSTLAHGPLHRLRHAGLGIAASFCLCAAPPVHAAQPSGPDPALVRQARAAQQTMERLARLQEQASDTRAAAARVSQTGQATLVAWQDYQRADQRTLANLEQAQDCLPLLQQRLDASTVALARRSEAVARSQQAVRDLAVADGGSLAPAAAAADAAFQHRQAAEKTSSAEQYATSQQASTCTSRARLAQREVQGLQDRAQGAVDLARELAPRQAALRARWQATAQAFSAAQRARLLAPDTLSVADTVETTDTTNAPLERLALAIRDTGLAERTARPSQPPFRPLTDGEANLERLTTELERLQDAVAYIELSTAEAPGDCTNNPCAGLLTERRDLTVRMADLQARLMQGVAQWQRSPAVLTEQLTSLATTRQALGERLRSLGSAIGPAVTETTVSSRAMDTAAARLQSAAGRAHEQARQDWERSHRLAYGTAPALPPHSSGTELASLLADSRPDQIAMAPDIRSHAYELFSSFDEEIDNFGAYTYVLVRSASDLQTPAVRQRFQQLLHILQTLPTGSLVSGGDRPHVNLFCIPVVPGNENAVDASEVVYASDLGQQIKMRAQNGLLTQKGVRERLTSAPGPFLITVPGRLATARSGTPVLMADLSGYPPDAIADLAHQYMNGLVDDFPRQQALWKPPVLQRVALFMIHLAEGTGELVTSALPTAQAQPR